MRRLGAIDIGRILLMLAILPALTSSGYPLAQAAETGGAPKSPQGQDEENRNFFTDLKVFNQGGEELRFYTDILKDKVVVISFFYVNCPTAQPALISMFRLQKSLGEKLGKDVLLLTLSVDPEKDTVEAIREYSRKFNPQKGWMFITGPIETMDTINKKLGNTLRLPEGHLRMFLLGNLKTGDWMRMLESAPVMALAEGIRSLEIKQ